MICLLGHRWSLIAGRLPGRTDNEIKNYWNTHIRRKLLSRGIDPVTHRPINEHTSNITISFEDWGQGKALKCPDLNLDLCISPPCQHEDDGEEEDEELDLKPAFVKREALQAGHGHGHGLCLGCGLGGQKGAAGCSCSNGHHFLGLRTSVLDFRGLEMK